MRSRNDRLRLAISFEIIGLLLIVPFGSLAFGIEMSHMGTLAIVGTLVATAYNYVFNLGFDHAMLRWAGHVDKRLGHRVLHAVLFETGLAIIMVPFVAWFLDVSLWRALVVDAAFVAFYLVYTFVFHWAYDRLFPVPQRASRGEEGRAG